MGMGYSSSTDIIIPPPIPTIPIIDQSLKINIELSKDKENDDLSDYELVIKDLHGYLNFDLSDPKDWKNFIQQIKKFIESQPKNQIRMLNLILIFQMDN